MFLFFFLLSLVLSISLCISKCKAVGQETVNLQRWNPQHSANTSWQSLFDVTIVLVSPFSYCQTFYPPPSKKKHTHTSLFSKLKYLFAFCLWPLQKNKAWKCRWEKILRGVKWCFEEACYVLCAYFCAPEETEEGMFWRGFLGSMSLFLCPRRDSAVLWMLNEHD